MMDRLPPDLLKQLHSALLVAFTDKSKLEQMVRMQLDQNLDEIVGGDNLSDIVFALIKWAESHGKLQELIQGAIAENPTNPALFKFGATWSAQVGQEQRQTLTEAAQPHAPPRRKPANLHPASFTYDVFISHSSADKPKVRQIAKTLNDAGLTVWFDEWIIQPGDSIPRKIQQGLQESRVMLLCMSESAFGSDWTTLESHTFLFRDPANEARRFVPLRLDECDIPDMLAQFLYIDWQGPDLDAQTQLIISCSPPTQLNTESVEATPVESQQSESIESARPNPSTIRHQPSPQSLLPHSPSPLKNVLGSGPINAVALTPDERYIITGADDGLVRLWDRETLACIQIMEGHQGEVNSVAVTRDGKQAISGSDDSTVKVWDLESGGCLKTLEGHQGIVYSVAV
ncbi:MAG: TIR domain-containing protein, partial [Chloroflexota bacterium]